MARRKQDDWFWHIGSELQRLSDEVMRGIVATTSQARRYWRPNVDLCESETDYRITVELAGVRAETVQIHYSPQRHSLVIRGRRDPDEPDRARRCYQLEVFYGEFEREVMLPDSGIDRDQVRARFEDGLLTISVPKKDEPPVRRNIPVTEE